MAMENCLQVSTARGAAFRCCQPFCLKGNLNLLKCGAVVKKSHVALCVSSPSFLRSSVGEHRKSRIFCKAREAVDEVRVVTDSNWKDFVIASESPVLVEFWAPWCGPCRMIAPIVDELAKEYAGKIACFKLNTDDCPNIATQYGIRSIPTVLFFKNGEKKESVIGAVPKSTLSATIDKYIDV